MASIAIGCSETQQHYELVSATGGFPESDRELYKSVLGYDLLRKVTLGNWECYAPHKDPDESLFCTHGSRTIMHTMGKGPKEIAIPTTSDNLNFLYLKDKDGNGSYDSLYYDGSDENGNHKRVLYDENLDGIPDKILDIETKTLKIRVGDKWIDTRSDKRDTSGKIITEITINGVQKRIYPSSYPYKIEELKSNKQLNSDSGADAPPPVN